MKKGSSDSPTNIFITIFVLLIILTILIYFSAQKLKSAASNKEMFANESSITFSPYLGSESYEKTTKQHMSLQDLQKIDSDQLGAKLASWERPYNGKTEGYINMEPCGIPPLTPIKSYPTLNFHTPYGPDSLKKVYGDPFMDAMLKTGHFPNEVI